MKKTQEYLESNGIHASQQRIKILEYLIHHPIHPTADEIFNELSDEMPTLSKTTVYNTLKLFVDKHLVQQLNIENGELRTLVLPIRDRYETIFRFTPFAVRLRIGFSGWGLTWEVTALRRLENSLEIDLGLRIS